jgi:hypothetical protein
VGGGGLVVDDPESVFPGSVRGRAGVEEAVDTDRDGADGGGACLFFGGWIGPGGEGELVGGGGMWGDEPKAVGIAEGGGEGGERFSGEASDGRLGKAVGAEKGRETREPSGKFGEEFLCGAAGGDAGGERFQRGVDDVSKSTGGEGALRARKVGVRGGGSQLRVAVGEAVGTGQDDARGGVEGERKAFDGGGCGCGEVEDEFVCGGGDVRICGLNPGLRIETWGTQAFVRMCGEVGLGGGPGG